MPKPTVKSASAWKPPPSDEEGHDADCWAIHLGCAFERLHAVWVERRSVSTPEDRTRRVQEAHGALRRLMAPGYPRTGTDLTLLDPRATDDA